MTEQAQYDNMCYFKELCREYIQRDGVENILRYLETHTDFYIAPASIYGHLNEAGGLCLHSINVFDTALRLHKSTIEPAIKEGRTKYKEEISTESIAICALLHDIHKCNIFHSKEKWHKDDNGIWQPYPGYEYYDDFPFGQGEKSCIILQHYMRLSREEMLAIRWSMGAFEMGENGSASRKSFYKACQFSPLIPLLQAANFLSSHCFEKTTHL